MWHGLNLIANYQWRCCLPLLLYCLLPLSSDAVADEKPHAPDSIPGSIVVTAEEVAELILSKPDLLIIDSRKKSEFSKGHIEGSINLLNTDMTQTEMERISPDKTTAIVFYCNGTRCLRSSDAIHKAMEWGYKNIFWFRGGWKEWSDKRLPVITD